MSTTLYGKPVVTVGAPRLRCNQGWYIVRPARQGESSGYLEIGDQMLFGKIRPIFPAIAHHVLEVCEAEGVESITLMDLACLTSCGFFGPYPADTPVALDLARAFIMLVPFGFHAAEKHLYAGLGEPLRGGALALTPAAP